MKLLHSVWTFFKDPIYKPYKANLKLKRKIFYGLLKWDLLFGIVSAIILSIPELLFDLDFGEHAIEEFIKEYSAFELFLFAVIIAPALEELIFRGPMGFFKNSKYFKWLFYILTFAFALVHLTNFESIDGAYYLIPLLILPQLIGSIFMGFARVKLGLKWSIMLHATFNAVIIGPIIIYKLVNEIII